MTRREVPPRRSAFTLIELLIVVAIIAVLVGLTTAAALRFFGKVPETQAQNDMARMTDAVGSFKQEFNVDYVPSIFILRERYDPATLQAAAGLERASINYLSRMFGSRFNPFGPHDWTGRYGGPQNVPPMGQGTPPVGSQIVLEGPECLVFFLGGVPDPGGKGVTGFNSSPTSPTTIGGSRRGPFFEFKATRLAPGTPQNGGASQGRMLVYFDPFESDTPRPYAFFSSAKGGYNQWAAAYAGSDCKTLGLIPYFQSAQGTPPNQTFRYYNHDGIQIICAGADGLYGPGGLLAPGSPPADDASKDNLVNFTRFKLGSESRD